MLNDWKAGGFGLYVHWPFCESKCPYCDFNSHVQAHVDQNRWLRAYLAEIERYADQLSGRVLNSVFFGGGTPSLMEPEVVQEILNKVKSCWTFANDIEITLEANPSSVEATLFAGFSEAGVNRVSLGVQALNDADLKRLGRLHTADEALQAIEIAESFFSRVSFDLIYARQDQTLEKWQAELDFALSLAVDHLSLYQLTIEDGTAFGDRYKSGKLRGLPGEDTSADMYFLTQDVCAAKGLHNYEVSNFAKPGAESRHNLIYWRYGDYVGIGPGAHGRISIDGTKYATDTWRSPDRWLTAVQNGSGEKLRNPLSDKDQAMEYLLMGLRISEGIDTLRYRALNGSSFSDDTLNRLMEMGLVNVNGDTLRTTQKGRILLNSVITELAEP